MHVICFLSPFLSFPCLSRGSSFCNHCTAFLFQINEKSSTNRLQWHVHTLYNPTFSRMVRVISSFLPLTETNLECDYYIEKVTLFAAFPTSTYLILLHRFDCLHLFSLCISETEFSGVSIIRMLSFFCKIIWDSQIKY